MPPKGKSTKGKTLKGKGKQPVVKNTRKKPVQEVVEEVVSETEDDADTDNVDNVDTGMERLDNMFNTPPTKDTDITDMTMSQQSTTSSVGKAKKKKGVSFPFTVEQKKSVFAWLQDNPMIWNTSHSKYKGGPFKAALFEAQAKKYSTEEEPGTEPDICTGKFNFYNFAWLHLYSYAGGLGGGGVAGSSFFIVFSSS